MHEVITFPAALERTDGNDRALLLGNGFSAKYANYSTLLEKAELAPGSAVRALFDLLKTVDFEAVVRSLEQASLVETAYGNGQHAKQLELDAQLVREALVHAVRKTHPAHREELAPYYDGASSFLSKFTTVFTLNYDLLLYWVSLEGGGFSDGFGLGTNRGRFRGPFHEDANCSIYNLHGGLHLFDDGTGEIIKAMNSGDGVIATIASAITEKKRLPIYVAEGSSDAKMQKINSIRYLRHCYEQLLTNAAPNMFIYGHSADDNDAHIYRAIFNSGVKHVYFSTYRSSEEKLKAFSGQLAKQKEISGSNISYTFFDAESAGLWVDP